MQTVDRNEFISYTEGVLLDFKEGKGMYVNEQRCEEALTALDSGEKIGLTKKGKLVSTVRLVGEEYVEVPFEE